MPSVEITDKMKDVLERYARRRITRANAAARMGISDRQVNRLMQQLGLERAKSARAQEEESAAQRLLMKEKAAEAVLAGRLSPTIAAERAGVHPRTILRHVEKLKKKRRPG